MPDSATSRTGPGVEDETKRTRIPAVATSRAGGGNGDHDGGDDGDAVVEDATIGF